MSSATVRVSKESHMILQEIKGQEGLSAQEILDRALESYRRKLFLKKCAEAYQAAKDDKKIWDDELGEREKWDTTVSDGLEKDK